MANVWKQWALESLGATQGSESGVIIHQNQMRLSLKDNCRKLKAKIDSYIRVGETSVKEGYGTGDTFNEFSACCSNHPELAMLSRVLSKVCHLQHEAEEARSQLHGRLFRDVNPEIERVSRDLKAAKAAKLNFDKHRLEYDAAVQKLSSLKKSKAPKPEKVQQAEQEVTQTKAAFEQASRDASETLVEANSMAEREIIQQIILYVEHYRMYYEAGSRAVLRLAAEIAEYRDYVNTRATDIEVSKARARSVVLKQINTNHILHYFGVPLKSILNVEGGTIPRFITSAFTYLREKWLDEEGLFRVAASKAAVSQYVEVIDSGRDPDFFGNQCDPTIVADVTKLFFRDLPEPLLTFALYEPFIHTTNLATDEEKIAEMRQLVAQLPFEHRALAEYLFAFLADVASHSSKNKMGAANLATIFGPSVLVCKTYNPGSMAEQMALQNLAIVALIRYHDKIFGSSEAAETPSPTASLAPPATTTSTPPAPGSAPAAAPVAAPAHAALVLPTATVGPVQVTPSLPRPRFHPSKPAAATAAVTPASELPAVHVPPPPVVSSAAPQTGSFIGGASGGGFVRGQRPPAMQLGAHGLAPLSPRGGNVDRVPSPYASPVPSPRGSALPAAGEAAGLDPAAVELLAPFASTGHPHDTIGSAKTPPIINLEATAAAAAASLPAPVSPRHHSGVLGAVPPPTSGAATNKSDRPTAGPPRTATLMAVTQSDRAVSPAARLPAPPPPVSGSTTAALPPHVAPSNLPPRSLSPPPITSSSGLPPPPVASAPPPPPPSAASAGADSEPTSFPSVPAPVLPPGVRSVSPRSRHWNPVQEP